MSIVLDYVVFIALVVPWLNPFASGPTPAVQPWLVSAICAAVLIGLIYRLQPRAIALAWIWAAVLSALAGLLQYFGFAYIFSPLINIGSLGEAYANLRQRNQFATLTNIGLVTIFWWLAQSRKSRHSLSAILLAAALFGAANAASSSRTGLLELGLVAALLWRWGHLSHSDVRWVFFAAVFTYGVAAVLFPLMVGLDPDSSGILARLHDGDPACASRITLWSNVLHLIAQKPMLGWGWGDLEYAHFVTLYPDARFCDILDNAHNLPLHLAVVLGIPFATLFCVGCGWLVARARPWRETDLARQMAWAVLAVVTLHSFLEYPLWYGPFQMATLLCVYVLSRRRATVDCLSHAGRAAVAACLISIGACSAWDYWRISQIYLPAEVRAEAYREGTLEKIQGTWLFRDQVRFAELSTTPVSRETAEAMLSLAKEMLHFSPEPRVVEKLLDSALLLGRDDDLRFYMDRYKRAFPAEYKKWVEIHTPQVD